MSVNRDEYSRMTDKATPPSKSGAHLLTAFIVGGAICCLGQGLLELYGSLGMSEDIAGACCSVTLVFLSALTTGIGWYEKLASRAGAGTLVPITGFANAVAAPAVEFRSEGMVLGLAAKMFVIAGPVIVYGVSAAAVYGIVLFAFGLY